MLTIGLFGRKKAHDPSADNAKPVVPSRLQEIAGQDSELYQALSRLLFIDPKKIMTSLESALAQATQLESTGDKKRAEVWYRIAGGIALYRGDAESVRKYFEKASSIAGDSRPEYNTIAKRSQDAVSVAKKYYENA